MGVLVDQSMDQAPHPIRHIFAYTAVHGRRTSLDGETAPAREDLLQLRIQPFHTRSARERYCGRCEAERAPRRRIYMLFQLREQWNCQFIEEDLKTPVRRSWLFCVFAIGFVLCAKPPPLTRGRIRSSLDAK